jgi:hypothetical protein
MKNIHILPTDQSSRLYLEYGDGDLCLSNSFLPQTARSNNQNLYITSDEEIKKDEYYLGDDNHIYNLVTSVNNNGKKIILTTNQDLIYDGVQAIDDEFLEWFVKNPTCEYVEVKKRYSDFTVDPFVGYKIIIPQEEPKYIEDKFEFESRIINEVWNRDEEPKQESYICPKTNIQCDDECCVSAEDCHIISSLATGMVDCKEPKQETPAYVLISNYYGKTKTKRSNVPLINHIDEGIEILKGIGADEDTIEAYCLHPILQSDEEFNKNLTMDFSGISTSALLLAVEYRRVANSYLSTDKIENFVGFTNEKIKQMLYADKIQNEKDFALYHEGKHDRSKELREYFNNWLNILLK